MNSRKPARRRAVTAAPRTARRRTRSAPPAAPARPAESRRATPRLAVLPEPPHTHLVCRSCARIIELPMEFDHHQVLEQLVARAPDGWSIDSITVSVTGACPKCRQGLPA